MRYIYVHGLGQSSDSWEQVIAMTDTSADSESVNLSALSQGNAASYADIYGAFCAHCDKIPDRLSLCGLSLGGVLALNYALEHPQRVSSMALIAVQFKMNKMKTLLRLQNAAFRLMPNSAFSGTGFGKSDFITLCKSMSRLDFSDNLQSIKCPVLIVCGSRDRFNLKASVSLNQRLSNSSLKGHKRLRARGQQGRSASLGRRAKPVL